jgi:hypothetical protein
VRRQVAALRKRSKSIPDKHLLVQVGDMITEEVLPTYTSMLNTLEGTRDKTGASASAWTQWTRKWTAEENRHGDAMNKCVRLAQAARAARLRDRSAPRPRRTRQQCGVAARVRAARRAGCRPAGR